MGVATALLYAPPGSSLVACADTSTGHAQWDDSTVEIPETAGVGAAGLLRHAPRRLPFSPTGIGRIWSLTVWQDWWVERWRT